MSTHETGYIHGRLLTLAEQTHRNVDQMRDEMRREFRSLRRHIDKVQESSGKPSTGEWYSKALLVLLLPTMTFWLTDSKAIAGAMLRELVKRFFLGGTGS